jgi:hypothetical protein
MKTLCCSLNLILLAFGFGTHSVIAEDFFDVNIVDTSIAYGTLQIPPGYGMQHDVAVAGTLLSTELADIIFSADLVPGIPTAYRQQIIDDYALLTNQEFLTSDLVQFGNSGRQLIELFENILADLQAAFPDRAFTLTFTDPLNPPSICQDCGFFTGVHSFELNGGFVENSPAPGDTTYILGLANVDFYRVNAIIKVVPEPSTLGYLSSTLVLLLGLPQVRQYARALGPARRVG